MLSSVLEAGLTARAVAARSCRATFRPTLCWNYGCVACRPTPMSRSHHKTLCACCWPRRSTRTWMHAQYVHPVGVVAAVAVVHQFRTCQRLHQLLTSHGRLRVAPTLKAKRVIKRKTGEAVPQPAKGSQPAVTSADVDKFQYVQRAVLCCLTRSNLTCLAGTTSASIGSCCTCCRIKYWQ